MKEPREIVLNDPNSVYSYIKELWGQLAQAKKIIKNLIGCLFYLFEYDNKTRGHKKINEAIEQAEQFLEYIIEREVDNSRME